MGRSAQSLGDMTDHIQGPVFSVAAQKLRDEMARRGLTRADVADLLDVDPSVLRRWLNGQRRPETLNALKIRRKFRIAPQDWFAPIRSAA